MRSKGGFGSLPLVQAMVALSESDAKIMAAQFRRNKIIREDCHVRIFPRTVRGGGTWATVYMVVVRKKVGVTSKSAEISVKLERGDV